MKTSKTATLIALLTVIMLAAFCSTTCAITGNSQPDSTSYVCVVVLFNDAAMTQPISISSGVLISPTVVLTAGHSVLGRAACVCFDQGPITYSIDATTGKIQYNTNQPIYTGVPTPYPAYLASVLAGTKDSKLLQTSDVGLIILNTPVQEVNSFPSLPTSGLADTLHVKTALQVIGYGIQNPSKGNDFPLVGSISRNSATVNLLSTHFQGSDNYLKCSANAAQGKGGIAPGDSGGPVIFNSNGQATVLAVNAYVNNGNCAGVTYHTRIDNPYVLAWISLYVPD